MQISFYKRLPNILQAKFYFIFFFSNILFFDDDVSRNPSCPGMLGEVLKKQDSNAFPQ